MGYTAQPGAMLNVEGSFNQYFQTQLTAKGLPAFMSTAVVNFDWPRQPLTFPSFSIAHLFAVKTQLFEGHQLDPGWKGAEMVGLAQIDCWESYNRASGSDKYNIRVMADMAQRVFATGAAIPILDVYGTITNPTSNGTILRCNPADNDGLLPDPNPDVTRVSLRVQYRWMARA